MRNDLEAPARTIAPMIGDVLREIASTGALLARMSGSGATCFGIYAGAEAARRAAAAIAERHPGWYARACRTRYGIIARKP
jgi:4-diphosphocytidyl-2-C-methyl-D-erythritol kinase